VVMLHPNQHVACYYISCVYLAELLSASTILFYTNNNNTLSWGCAIAGSVDTGGHLLSGNQSNVRIVNHILGMNHGGNDETLPLDPASCDDAGYWCAGVGP